MENRSNFIPSSDREALNWLTPVLDQVPRALSNDAFKQAWAAVFYLYQGLHPDDAVDHGEVIVTEHEASAPIQGMDRRLIDSHYEQSGWPVALVPLAEEAWRRYEADTLEEDFFYCSEAQFAGMMDRRAG